MRSPVRVFVIMVKVSGMFLSISGNNAKKLSWPTTLPPIYITLHQPFLLYYSFLYTQLFLPTTRQSSLLCTTQKSLQKITPLMPRCGGCRRALEDAFFDRDRRGALRRTCRACLVSNFIHSTSLLLTIWYNSKTSYFRRDKILEDVLEEQKVDIYKLNLRYWKDRRIKVCSFCMNSEPL